VIHKAVYITGQYCGGKKLTLAQKLLLDRVLASLSISPRAVTFSWWGIVMLAGVFILLVGPLRPDRLKDRGQTK